MSRVVAILTGAIVLTAGLLGSAQPPANAGPYNVLKAARVGGEGGWDYIYADVAGRRLYIPRRGIAAVAATDAHPAVPAVPSRLSIYNLDTLELIKEMDGVGGNGAAVDPKSDHGFTSSRPVSMFDTKTMALIKTIDVGTAQPDGIIFDAFNDRVYVFSHPTKNAVVIDSKDGTVVGAIDLGGVPEQGVADGKGMLYVVMQDAEGSVTAVDVKTMKATAHYPLGDKGSCNGLALDVKNSVLFAACARSGNPLSPQPMMVVLSASDGKILANLPLAGGSTRRVQSSDHGGVQHAWQRHADRRQGKQPDELRGRAEPADHERRAHGDIRQQDAASADDERRARTGAAAAAGWRPRRSGHASARLVHHSHNWKVGNASARRRAFVLLALRRPSARVAPCPSPRARTRHSAPSD